MQQSHTIDTVAYPYAVDGVQTHPLGSLGILDVTTILQSWYLV